jgi:acyl-CoA thioester hydrolase
MTNSPPTDELPGAKAAPCVIAMPRPMRTQHTAQVRVRYCECDPMGIVHHAAYVPWLEIARTELLRASGVSYAELEAAGVLLVVVKLDVSYKRPAYYDDLVDIRTRTVGPSSRVKIRHEYEIVRASDEGRIAARASAPGLARADAAGSNTIAQSRTPGEVLVSASTLLACIDRSGRPAPLPDWLITPGSPPANAL